MSRAFWKGNIILKPLYASLVSSITSSRLSPKNIKLFKRNQKLFSKNLLATSSDWESFNVYNGYDFFDKLSLLQENPDIFIKNVNTATLVHTREMTVKHKAKLSKSARRAQLIRSKKKSTGIVTKSGVKLKKK